MKKLKAVKYAYSIFACALIAFGLASATAETDEGRNGREQQENTHLGSPARGAKERPPQSAALPRYFLSWARMTCWVSGWKNSRVP